MKFEKINLFGKRVYPFTIPSGIVMTDPRCARRLLDMIPELGIWTTKSIGPEPRIVPEREEVENPFSFKQYAYREPILVQDSPGNFLNAVGLTNPGKDEFRKLIMAANIPKDRFILCSIYGRNALEFLDVAKTLEDVVDGFEGNFSCPHVKGHGMQLGQDPRIVYEITREVVRNTTKPFFAKLTPATDNVPGGIGAIAKAAIEGGAYGIVAINTLGVPNEFLYNGFGGKSGRWIRDLGIKRVREIREAVGKTVFILGMGGIENADDVRDYTDAGANAVGIGTSLAGKDDEEIKTTFQVIAQDLRNGTNYSKGLVKKVDMTRKEVKIREITNDGCDFKIFKTYSSINALPGQFVFAYLPGDLMPNGKPNEKPFSIMDDNPLTLGVLERGYFTRRFNSLKVGDSFYVKGPYGVGVDVPEDSEVVLVGGGCGIAGILLLAKRFSEKANIVSFLGAKDKDHLGVPSEFSEYGWLEVATEDGSLGRKGSVLDLMRDYGFKPGSYFFNCGPRAMVEAVLPLELEVSSSDRVYSSVDYITRCGVGICGSCSDKNGLRTCVEGPFMTQ